jgi:hypothetical protein
MKKAFASILLFAYITAAAGTALRLHYCEGRWMTNINLVWINSFSNNTACKQKDQLPNCCKHPKIKVKINPDQQIAYIYSLKIFHFTRSLIFADNKPDHPAFIESSTPSPDHSPPKWLTKINFRQAFYGKFLI